MQSRSCFGVAMAIALTANATAADPTKAVDASTHSSASWIRIDIPAQSLADSIQEIARQTNTNILVDPNLIVGRKAPAINQQMSLDQALSRLLKGTGLESKYVDERTIVVAAAMLNTAGTENTRAMRLAQADPYYPSQGKLAGSADESENDNSSPSPGEGSRENLRDQSPLKVEEVVVTGTNIRGAEVATIPVISINQRDMLEAGQNSLSEVVRSLPQNFSGGQNPSVRISGGGIANGNITGASSINLRGLGPDATLTLLNGRRLSYNGAAQAVDISAIPIVAVDRIEIVADGASAIYGSDAVAGVANVVLKRDFDGIAATARYGASTEGGNEQKQYSLVGGATWSTGGFMASYDYENIGALLSDERSYTDYMYDPATLLPEIERHNVLISAHQSFTPSISVGVDALYNERESLRLSSSATSLNINTPVAESHVISPWMTIRLPAAWSMTLGGSFAEDTTLYDIRVLNNAGVQTSLNNGCYCNRVTAGDLNFEGALFELPAGAVRASTGGGYRKANHETRAFNSNFRTAGAQESYYAYAELFAPVISPAQDRSLVHRLALTSALRYEDYRGVGSVTTPKVGVIYAATEDLQIKASWGKSFKAATLSQQFSPVDVGLQYASGFGGAGYPARATVLHQIGGDPELSPERSNSWSTTVSFTPQAVAGLSIDLSYFDVAYTDRVVRPLFAATRALTDPAMAEFIDTTPTLAEMDEVIAMSPTGLNNLTGLPYDPATVVAILHNGYMNVAREDIQGIDLSTRYVLETKRGLFIPQLQASWLESERKNSNLSSPFPLAGTAYNPSHLRARGGLVWRNETGLTVSSFINYIGKLDDTRTIPYPQVDPMTTVDITAIYRVPTGASFFSDVTFALSVLNVADEAPSYVRNTDLQVENYDSTNHSPIGRFVNVSVTKQWDGRR